MRSIDGMTFVKYLPSLIDGCTNLPVGSRIRVDSVRVDPLFGDVAVWAHRLDNGEHIQIAVNIFVDFWALEVDQCDASL